MEGSYAKGKPNGRFTYWSTSGSVAGRFKMRKGTGTMKTFHDSGELASELAMVRGVRHGAYREYSTHGQVTLEGAYRNDEKHGEWITRNGGGELVREERYVAGKLEGVVRQYRRGLLAAEQTYAGGLREGPYRELVLGKAGPEGDPVERVTGEYAADRKSGEWIYRGADGQPALVEHYQDGALQGGFQELVGGQVVVRGQHEHGRRSGVWAWATPKGDQVRTITYDAP
jgi:antitoxin component YwqK of YwqJK toxin-antitoxin module